MRKPMTGFCLPIHQRVSTILFRQRANALLNDASRREPEMVRLLHTLLAPGLARELRRRFPEDYAKLTARECHSLLTAWHKEKGDLAL